MRCTNHLFIYQQLLVEPGFSVTDSYLQNNLCKIRCAESPANPCAEGVVIASLFAKNTRSMTLYARIMQDEGSPRWESLRWALSLRGSMMVIVFQECEVFVCLDFVIFFFFFFPLATKLMVPQTGCEFFKKKKKMLIFPTPTPSKCGKKFK